MALYLPIGEPAGVPPVGEKCIHIKSDGAASLMDATGAESAIGDGTTLLSGGGLIGGGAGADTNAFDIIFDGETIGGIEIDVWFQTPTIINGGGVAAEYYCQPNGLAPVSGGNFVSKGSHSSVCGIMFATLPTANTRVIAANIKIPVTKALRGPRNFLMRTLDSAFDQQDQVGWWYADGTALTSLRFQAFYANAGGPLAGIVSFISTMTSTNAWSSKSGYAWQQMARAMF
jgi:hypothetical protein